MSAFGRPFYWHTDLGVFEACGFDGARGGDGNPYALVLVRWQRGPKWGEFDQVRLDPADNPVVQFDRWRYRVTGYTIVPGVKTLPPSVAGLPVTGCGHAYFPAPEGPGAIQLITGDMVCQPCSDAREREAMRGVHARAARFEFQLSDPAPSGMIRVTTPLGGLVGVARVADTQARRTPHGVAWTWRRYEMRDVHGQVWTGEGAAAATRVGFKRKPQSQPVTP